MTRLAPLASSTTRPATSASMVTARSMQIAELEHMSSANSAARRSLELNAYREPGSSGGEGGEGGGDGGGGGGSGGEGGEGGEGGVGGGGGGAAPQLTATCASAASPHQPPPRLPPPRLYSKANDAEYTPTLTTCHAIGHAELAHVGAVHVVVEGHGADALADGGTHGAVDPVPSTPAEGPVLLVGVEPSVRSKAYGGSPPPVDQPGFVPLLKSKVVVGCDGGSGGGDGGDGGGGGGEGGEGDEGGGGNECDAGGGLVGGRLDAALAPPSSARSMLVRIRAGSLEPGTVARGSRGLRLQLPACERRASPGWSHLGSDTEAPTATTCSSCRLQVDCRAHRAEHKLRGVRKVLTFTCMMRVGEI
eukprot:scaffold57308_cov59-Phaeocystis_antarctica.AAC.3